MAIAVAQIAASAWTRCLAWEFPYATGAAEKVKIEREREREGQNLPSHIHRLPEFHR